MSTQPLFGGIHIDRETGQAVSNKDKPGSLALATGSAPHYKMVCAPDAPTLCEYVNSNLLAGFVPVGGPLLVRDRLWQAMIRWPNSELRDGASRSL